MKAEPKRPSLIIWPPLALLLALLMAQVIAVAPLHAQDMDDVIHAMREGNFAEAYCILKPHADAGDAEAQYNIGWMYLNGYGLAINDSLALEWWLRASEQGYTDAHFSIAMLYTLGDGQVEKDMDRALDYYLLAAEDGHEDARQILRSMLQRDDKAMRERREQIINTYGSMLGELKQVKGERVNVRNGPGMDHAIIAGLHQGDAVLALGSRGNWTNVILPESGKPAWIYTTLLQAYAAPQVPGSSPSTDEPTDRVVESQADSQQQVEPDASGLGSDDQALDDSSELDY